MNIVERFKNEILWVKVTHKDGTYRKFRSTLNGEILKNNGYINRNINTLFDLDKKKVVSITDLSVELSDTEFIGGDVFEHINRFL